MTTTANFGRISAVFIFDWIFWAVRAALSLHIHKKKALVMFVKERNDRQQGNN